jgi:ABC-type sugar transport system substrate-binding protein
MEGREGGNLTFVLVSQQKENAFFDAVRDGCLGAAKKLSRKSNRNVTCIYRYPEKPDIWAQQNLIQKLVRSENSPKLHGIILIPLSPSTQLAPVINEATQKGIAVVVVNEDIPDSMRLARVATDNYELGRTLGKILLQLRPHGGNYATLRAEGETLDLRGQGLSEYLADTQWNLLADKSLPENIDLMMDQMGAFPIEHPSLSAIIPLGGWPMYHPERWINFVEKYQSKIAFVSADALPVQIDLLNSGHVNGLAGQASNQIGSKALDVLYNHHLDPATPLPTDIFVTSIMEFVRVPIVLPPLVVNKNHIGNLMYLGFFLFGVIALTSVAFAAWIWAFREVRVVQVGQPIFLYMVVVGVFVMGSTLIPLSFR